jgi:hypothetical protein
MALGMFEIEIGIKSARSGILFLYEFGKTGRRENENIIFKKKNLSTSTTFCCDRSLYMLGDQSDAVGL